MKAIGPDGREDGEPFTLDIPRGDGSANQQITQIIEKPQIGQVYTSPNLQVNFATEGASSDMRYECQRETEPAFQLCPEGNRYTFPQLNSGDMVSLTVRGIMPSGEPTIEDQIAFKVELPQMAIGGADLLRQQTSGTVGLQFPRQPGIHFNCSLNDGQPEACVPNYERIALGSLDRGNHTLRIQQYNGDGLMQNSTEIPFCAGSCQSQGLPHAPIAANFQLGSHYSFSVPEGMHIAKYATTKTFDNLLLTYALAPNPASSYLGPNLCGPRSTIVTAATPTGNVKDYCRTVVPRQQYKVETDFRLAHNHIDVITDEELVAQNPFANRRMIANVFDRDYEFQYKRSVFEQLVRTVPMPLMASLESRCLVVTSSAIRYSPTSLAAFPIWFLVASVDYQLHNNGGSVPSSSLRIDYSYLTLVVSELVTDSLAVGDVEIT